MEPLAEPIRSSERWTSASPVEQADSGVTAWSEARRRLAEGRTYWLATGKRDGQPHVVPVLAVLHGGMVYFVASPSSRKAQNLRRRPRCVVTVNAEAIDLVVEGTAQIVCDETTLESVAGL